jgi:primosomal protein N' (replication factor Y)
MLRFTKELAQYYGCSWGEAIETSLPDLLRKKSPQEFNKPVKATSENPKPHVKLVHDKGQTKRWPYLADLIRKTLEQQQGVIVLVPEVAALAKLQSIFQQHQLPAPAVIDKRLSDKEEFKHWVSIKESQSRLAIGTRSAIFAPVAALGLIIILEEENSAYRQEQSPSYHVREVAQMRSQVEGCQVVFVGSTPSAEIWAQARRKNTRVTLDAERIGALQIIDMSNYKPRKRSFISFPLQNYLQKTLNERGKVILFLNRKGFSTSTRCNQCGHVMKCPRCDVSLTYLFSRKQLVCHLCGEAAAVPTHCPKCNSAYMRSLGTGIEKIESELARVFPYVQIARFDKDTDQLPQNANIIIATQAIVKHLDKIAVDLIGILEIDAELNRPDFRSAQRVFSLLIHFRQAAKDKVVVQTFNPSNYAIKAANKFNFNSFYKEELALRKELGFPPFAHLIEVGLRGPEETAVFEQAKKLYEKLLPYKKDSCEVLEPQPDLQPKLRDKYRFTIMVKTKKTTQLLKSIKSALKGFSRKKNVVITINLDP